MGRARRKTSTRRVPLGAIIPFALVAVAALLWSIGWVFAAREGERLWAGWLADQARQGRSFACARQDFGGFPFRLEMTCDRPEFADPGAAGGTVVTARGLRAVAQVYDLDHVIVEVDGPLAVADAAGSLGARIETGAVRASIMLDRRRIDRLSVVVPASRVEIAGAPEPTTVAFQECQLHTRRRPADGALDLALSGRGLAFVGPVENRVEAVEVETFDLKGVIARPVEGSVFEAVDLLRRWRAAGGVVDITQLSFRSPALGADAKGSVSIAPDGTIEGALDAALVRLDAFIDILKERGAITANEATISVGAAQFFGRPTEAGEKRVTLPIRIRAGEVYIGPIRATRLPPVLEPMPGAG